MSQPMPPPAGMERLAGRDFAMACRLACVLAEAPPTSALPAGLRGRGAGVDVAALANLPPFARSVRRALAGARETVADFDAHEIVALSSRAAGRFALLVATRSRSDVEHVALLTAAAVLHRRILRLALRQDRTRVREALGAETMRVATQEVPALYPSLAMLDAGDPYWDVVMGADAAAGRRAAIRYGLDVVLSAVDGTSRPLGALARRRLELDDENLPVMPPAFEPPLLKFVSRRGQSWSVIIG